MPFVDSGAARLAAGIRTLAYDRRGFGATRDEPQSHCEMDDALAVLDAERAGPAIVIGASNGGRRAVDLVLAHPDRVRALVLITCSRDERHRPPRPGPRPRGAGRAGVGPAGHQRTLSLVADFVACHSA